jgi:hypothetical protein
MLALHAAVMHIHPVSLQAKIMVAGCSLSPTCTRWKRCEKDLRVEASTRTDANLRICVKIAAGLVGAPERTKYSRACRTDQREAGIESALIPQPFRFLRSQVTAVALLIRFRFSFLMPKQNERFIRRIVQLSIF